MDKISKILISTRTMAVILLVYIISLSVATFIENDFGTPTAKVLVYDAKWFEFVQFLLICNFIGNMFRYNLFRKEKWPLLLFHLSFVVLFIGGAITRYISYEGMMGIREGEMNNKIISDKNYFKLSIQRDGEVRTYKEIPYSMAKMPKIFSAIHNNFSAKYDFLGDKIQVKTVGFIPRAKDSIVPNINAKRIIHLVSTSDNGRENFYISEGEIKDIKGILVGFNIDNPSAIQINEVNGSYKIFSPFKGNYMIMATQSKGNVADNSIEPFNFRSLYDINGLKFVVPTAPVKGNLTYFEGDKTKDKNEDDRIAVEISYKNLKDTLIIKGGKGNTNMNSKKQIGDATFVMGYGAKEYETDFYLKLRDFQMEKYPGSNSPSSFASEVSIVDKGKETPFRIYMNHVLDYKGYRFFQSGFDPDERGTQLSVNHDAIGTFVSYIGYGMLFLGLFLTLFWKGTRFWSLNSKLNEIMKSKKTLISCFLFLFSFFSFSQSQHKNPKPIAVDSLSKLIKIDEEHSTKFGALLIQNFSGRIVPANTMALELLKKLTHKESFGTLNANQWFLSTMIIPASVWANTPLIYIGDNAGDELKKKLHVDENNLTTMVNLFRFNGKDNFEYVIEKDFNRAFAKKPADKSSFDKEIININDRVQALQTLLSFQYHKFIPKEKDVNNTWTSGLSNDETGNIKVTDSLAFKKLNAYTLQVSNALNSGKWKNADKALEDIKEYQKKISHNILPSDSKIFWEITYNKYKAFFWLMIFYSIIGSLLLISTFVKLFKENKIVNVIEKVLLSLLLLGTFLHAFALGIRWYISGHAPWSNGYEAVMFISLIAVIAGFIINFKNNFRNKIGLFFVGILSAIVFYSINSVEVLESVFFGLAIYFTLSNGISFFTKLRQNLYINAFIPIAGCFAAVIIMGFAHGGVDLNPQITPLVPVLKSYWLMVHVAIITSSYGFFGLSAILGFLSLILYIIQSKKSFKKIDNVLKELIIVNEMSLVIGLFLLAIGTFLGGIWANESWGRYWSWDPKETWAYISVMVYAFVLHMRLVPGLQSKWLFNYMSLIAFSSIIMTYFGVNYYLSGLHSYAAGDKIPIPNWVWFTLIIFIAIGIISYLKYKLNYKIIKNDKR